MTAGTATPRGLGLYLGRVVREWDAGDARKHAAKAKRARIRHVALCAEALDGWRANPGVLVDCTDVYRNEGIAVWVYSLPGPKAVSEPGTATADWLAECGIAVGARGWILDAEESYRGHGATLLAHRDRLTERASEKVSLGVTFYGTPSTLPAFPWPAISGWGWAGWQCYERAGSRRRVRDGLAELRSRWGADVVPHLATYERKTRTSEGQDGADRLAADLTRTCLDDSGVLDVPGVWLWSDASLDGRESDILAGWAERHGW